MAIGGIENSSVAVDFPPDIYPPAIKADVLLEPALAPLPLAVAKSFNSVQDVPFQASAKAE